MSLPFKTHSVPMQPVQSSNIAAAGYVAGINEQPGHLHIQFTSGATYIYADVPEAVYTSFLAAPSKGTFFARRIKGAFVFEKK